MTWEEDAYDCAWSDYVSRAQSDCEFGRVLFSAGGRFDSGPLIVSPSQEYVDLYDQNTKIPILSAGSSGATEHYRGDFHAHPVGVTWLNQFPSPSDIGSISILCDYWPIPGHQLEIAPDFQIVQSMFFGDLIVMVRAPGRRKFNSVMEQSTEISAMVVVYENAHSKANDIHGPIPSEVTRSNFEAVVSDVLAKLNQSLAGRGSMYFVRNQNVSCEAIWKRT